MSKAINGQSIVVLQMRRNDLVTRPIIMRAVYFKRLAYCGAMLSVALGGLVAAEPLRLAEPIIGSRIAEMFVFSVLRNNPERLTPAIPAARKTYRGEYDVAGRL